MTATVLTPTAEHLPRPVVEAILEGDDLVRHLDCELVVPCPICRSRVECTGGIAGAGSQVAHVGLVCRCRTQTYTGPLTARMQA